jgi:hypothetical protein
VRDRLDVEADAVQDQKVLRIAHTQILLAAATVPVIVLTSFALYPTRVYPVLPRTLSGMPVLRSGNQTSAAPLVSKLRAMS